MTISRPGLSPRTWGFDSHTILLLPITRSVQELTRRRILEIKKTQNILSPVFKVKGLSQQVHFKFKGYKIKITTKNEVKNQDKDNN